MLLEPQTRARRWLLIFCAGLVFSTFLAVLWLQRRFIYDDSFISYRYSHNLARGFGITWNVGERPVEGYTNFLLVVVLAPFIALGADPLWITRLLSVGAALGLAVLCAKMARPLCRDKESAVLAGLAFLPIGNTFLLTTVGLETVIYTFFLFLSFFYAREFLRGKENAIARFGLAQFLAFLLRPEAPLLSLLLLAFLVWRRRELLRRMLRALAWSLILPIFFYLLWKQIHFGTIVPNPFYIKVGGGAFPNPAGLRSVVGYLIEHVKLLTLVVGALWLSQLATRKNLDATALKNDDWQAQSLAAALVGAYLLFYLRVETLMDVYHRFLYPVTPFLFYLALPLTCFILEKMATWKSATWLRVMVGAFLYGLLFFQNPPASVANWIDAARGIDANSNANDIMQKEYSIAHKLKKFPDVRALTIAWGDAGVIPYFTQAKIIDVVGLNDHFIARTQFESPDFLSVLSQARRVSVARSARQPMDQLWTRAAGKLPFVGNRRALERLRIRRNFDH